MKVLIAIGGWVSLLAWALCVLAFVAFLVIGR
jgi:hypothetical protein